MAGYQPIEKKKKKNLLASKEPGKFDNLQEIRINESQLWDDTDIGIRQNLDQL